MSRGGDFLHFWSRINLTWRNYTSKYIIWSTERPKTHNAAQHLNWDFYQDHISDLPRFQKPLRHQSFATVVTSWVFLLQAEISTCWSTFPENGRARRWKCAKTQRAPVFKPRPPSSSTFIICSVRTAEHEASATFRLRPADFLRDQQPFP